MRQIAATGIDGIYVDIPYWMTHFDGWEDSWASFDDYTVEAFRQKTGLDARRDLKLGDFADPHFRQWIDFRIETITEFMREIDRNAKSVNPKIMTIPEIYPGIEREAVVVGADVYELYQVTDAIAHEYEFGGGDHMATSRTPLDWFRYQVGMHSFRAFAEGKATWILNYSWDGDKNIAPPEPMMNLAMSLVMAGANFWDAATHVMSGSNDLPTRKRIFEWIERHEKTLYEPREPIHPIGVYFSPTTRNYFPDAFLRSYQGILILLLQKHLEFQVVTPRTLAEFRGSTLILPDVRVLEDGRAQARSARRSPAGRDSSSRARTRPACRRSQALTRFPDCPGKSLPGRAREGLREGGSFRGRGFHRGPRTRFDRPRSKRPRPWRPRSREWTGSSTSSSPTSRAWSRSRTPFRRRRRGIRVSVAAADAGKAWFLPFLGEAQESPGPAPRRRARLRPARCPEGRGRVVRVPIVTIPARAWGVA